MSQPITPSEQQPPFDDELVEKALQQEESYTFDCKRLKEKLTRILETVTAFANSDGGVIALGLEDPDKTESRDRVYGIQEQPMKWDELRRLMRSRITESNLLLWKPVEVGCTLRDGSIGSVIFLRVEKSTRVHSIVDNGTFVRLNKGNKELTAPEINELSFARGTITAESQLEDVNLELLDTDYWRAYADKRRLTRPIGEAMEFIGLAKRTNGGKLLPTRAAVLLFAEEPSGLMRGKAAVRIFHYRGSRVQTDPNTNLLRPPRTVSGPVHRQIQDAVEAVVQELAKGIQMGPLGFEIVQRYPLRVIREAITNAVIHRDYRLPSDTHIRIFSDRIEVESPGLFAGPVTVANIFRIGTCSRNPLLVNSLREFPNPPNLDAGEGVRMMFGTMWDTGLYPPLYRTRPRVDREAVLVYLFNQNRPSLWEQVSNYIDQHGSIGNAELRRLMESDDALAASGQLRKWVDRGQLVVTNPQAGKRVRRYAKPDTEPAQSLFAKLGR